MEDHERLRQELESAAATLREDTDRRRRDTVRNAVIGSALGLLAAGLVVVGVILVSQVDSGSAPTQHSDAAPIVPTRRPVPRPPSEPGTSGVPPAPEPAPDPTRPPQPEPTSPPSELPTEHTVQRGESLARIAVRYGVPFEQIAEDNGISDPNRIRAGQKLVIRPPAAGTVVIQPGDTLSALARRHGTTVQALLARNPHITDPNRIVAGSRLRVS